jgi:hypothetical protein
MPSHLKRKRKSKTDGEETVKATKPSKSALPQKQKSQALKRIIQQYGKISTQLSKCFETFQNIEEEFSQKFSLAYQVISGMAKVMLMRDN